MKGTDFTKLDPKTVTWDDLMHINLDDLNPDNLVLACQLLDNAQALEIAMIMATYRDRRDLLIRYALHDVKEEA